MGLPVATGWRPSLIGDITHHYSRYYSRDWGFGALFEAKVAGGLADFFLRADPARDCAFRIDAADGSLLGAILVDGTLAALPADECRIRFFIVADGARGRGHGTRLLDAALAFIAKAGFRACHLTTIKGLDAARRLYEARGFRLTEEREGTTWGPPVIEQRFDLRLG